MVLYHKIEVSKSPFKSRMHLLNLVLTTVVAPLGTFPIIIAADLLIIPRVELQSIDFFLSHAQMDPESLQVDFEWACNLE
jgi:hypothetical protein